MSSLPASEADTLEVWHSLLSGYRSMTTRLNAHLRADHGLTPAQFEALRSLRLADGRMSSTELSRVLLYSSGSASNLISQLERAGHVLREQGDADARMVTVILTESGTAVIDAARAKHRERVLEEFAPLVGEDATVLVGFGKRLLRHEGIPRETARLS